MSAKSGEFPGLGRASLRGWGRLKSRTDDYLLAERESAAQLTFHIDLLRNRISSLFVSLVGIALTVVAILPARVTSLAIVSWALLTTAFVGLLVVLILARLRAVQLEHFRIINNIRETFLGTDILLWNVVELSRKSLPKERFGSGSYCWAALVMLTGSVSGGLAIAFATRQSACQTLFGLGGGFLALAAMNVIYFAFSRPPPRPRYGVDSSPFEEK